DSQHTADVGSLQAVELAGGQLRIALKTGEAYQFPVAELLTGEGADPVLQVQETMVTSDRMAFGGAATQARVHNVKLARLASIRLVEPEPGQAAERWSRARLTPEELERRERLAETRRRMAGGS